MREELCTKNTLPMDSQVEQNPLPRHPLPRGLKVDWLGQTSLAGGGARGRSHYSAALLTVSKSSSISSFTSFSEKKPNSVGPGGSLFPQVGFHRDTVSCFQQDMGRNPHICLSFKHIH